MLQKISDRIQGWVAGLIVAVIALVFAFWGIEYYIGRGGNNDKAVATVDGKKVTEKKLKLFYRQLKVQLKGATAEQIKQIALQQLISNTALVNAAKKAGFHVSPQQVQQLIMQAPEFQVNGRFAPSRFQQFLYNLQTSENKFIEEVQGNFITNQVAIGIENSAFVLPDEVQEAYRLIYETRSFGYMVLPLSQFKKGVTVSDKEIQQYYTQHKDAYKTPEKVQISYLLLSPKDLEQSISINPAEVKSFYKSNQSSYAIPKQWKILRVSIPLAKSARPEDVKKVENDMEKILKNVKAGEPLTEALMQSGAKSSTYVLTPGQVNATLGNVLASLKPGEVSGVFHTHDAVNLVKLISLTPGSVKPFDAVKSQIHKRLIHSKVQELLSQKNDQLSNLTYTNPSSLDVAAKQLGLKIQTSDWLTKKGAKQGIFSNPSVIAVAFSEDVLQGGNNSNPIELKDGSVIVLRVKSHKLSKVQALSAVKSTIHKVVLKNKAEAKAGLQAYQISTALGKGQSPEELAKKNNVKWIVKSGVKRDEKFVAAAIMVSVFSTVPASQKTKNTGVNTLIMANGDYVVLQVNASKLADVTQAKPKILKKLKEDLTKQNGQMDYRLYAKSVMDDAKIKIVYAE